MADTTGPFDLGKMAFGGLGQMFDGIDSVKRAWSMFNAPSALVPTLDVEELDKRIADLKAVEQWLNLNVSMLRGTIQGLEIQRGTLAAVKAFGASFGSPMTGMPSAAGASSSAAASSGAASGRPHPRTAPDTAPDAAMHGEPAPARGPNVSAPPADALPGIDPAAWWNLLQGTFNQVAQAALSGTGLPGLPPASGPAAQRTASATRGTGAGTGTKKAGSKKAGATRSKAAAPSRTRSRG